MMGHIWQAAPLPDAAPFLLAPDFTNVDYLKVLVERVVKPATEYFKTSMWRASVGRSCRE